MGLATNRRLGTCYRQTFGLTRNARTLNRTGHILLSVVIPSFDEELVIRETHGRLISALERIPESDFELVYIDDGSADATLEILRGVQDADDRVRIVALSRNFGHQIALTAGLEHASGDVVVVIDADLQDPPETIMEMVDHWRAGADVAYGVRSMRQGEGVSKRAFSRAFYRLMNRLSEVPVPLDTGDFRLMDRKVVDALMAMPEQYRYVRGMVAWTGFRQEPVHFVRAPRLAGGSKYSFGKMGRLAADGILSFSVIPLRLASYLGFAASVLALVGIVYALVLRLLTDVWVTGWTLLFIAMLFLGGVQLLVLGVIGEYLGRAYGELKRRPLYFVKETVGFPPRGTTDG